MKDKLYRSRKDKVISGVCGGLAEYFDVDPVIVRLIWAATVIFGGAGFIAYIVAIIVIPEKPVNLEEDDEKEIDDEERELRRSKSKNIIGASLIGVGALIILRRFSWFDWFSFDYVWPVALILLGAYFLFNKKEA